MKVVFGALPLLAAYSFLAVAPQANAASINLDVDECTGTCGTPPFGNIQVIQTTASLVTVTVTLAPNVRFAGTGAGEALEFNIVPIVGDPVLFGSLTAGFSSGGPATASAFGSFLLHIHCDDCQGGQVDNPAGPLSFTLTRTAGVTLGNFVGSSKGYLFAADIVGNNGKTGNVGAKGVEITTFDGGSVPEPMTISLLGGGLLAIFLRKAAQKRST